MAGAFRRRSGTPANPGSEWYIGITPGRSNRLAIFNVGKIEAAGAAANIVVIEDPVPSNPAHALMKESAGLQAQMVRAVIAATVPQSDIETY